MEDNTDTLPGMTPKEQPLPPSYSFAGTNLGGEMVYECGQCGCLLKTPKVATHSNFHAQLPQGEKW